MTPVACVQYFVLCLGGPSKFLRVVGSWSSWAPFTVNGESQTPLPRTIFIEFKMWVGVYRQPCLEWSVPQESQGNTGHSYLPRGLTLMTWIPTLWTSLPFLGRITRRYTPCCKMHIGNRHLRISQNLPKAFPSGHHPSNTQNMRRQNLPFWLHHQ